MSRQTFRHFAPKKILGLGSKNNLRGYYNRTDKEPGVNVSGFVQEL
jgi:hypothetical protein